MTSRALPTCLGTTKAHNFDVEHKRIVRRCPHKIEIVPIGYAFNGASTFADIACQTHLNHVVCYEMREHGIQFVDVCVHGPIVFVPSSTVQECRPGVGARTLCGVCGRYLFGPGQAQVTLAGSPYQCLLSSGCGCVEESPEVTQSRNLGRTR